MAVTPAQQIAAAIKRASAFTEATAAESQRIAAQREQDAARQSTEQALTPPKAAS